MTNLNCVSFVGIFYLEDSRAERKGHDKILEILFAKSSSYAISLVRILFSLIMWH